MRHRLPTALLMVRPRHFGYNPENADNTFGQPDQLIDVREAGPEFEDVVALLEGLGLKLLVLEDESCSPDAISTRTRCRTLVRSPFSARVPRASSGPVLTRSGARCS